MKYVIITATVFLAACATRHAPDTSTWFADCYNKQRQESLLAQAEAALDPNDLQGRRRVRQLFWDLQKACR